MTADLAGRVAVITGGNSGIGKETAVELAGMGATVVIAARNATKAASAIKEIQARTGAGDRVSTLPIDLASFASVRAFVDSFSAAHDRCDVLVNNAGGVLRQRLVTEDGHEMQFQVNHLSHFLLTNLMRDALAAAPDARVVNVASMAHKTARQGVNFADLDWEHRRYHAFQAYSETKLMNILFTRAQAKRWRDDGITVNAVHPGFVASNFGKEGDMGRWVAIGMVLVRPFAISNPKGARTSVYVASSPEVAGVTGEYFVKSRVTPPAAIARDDDAAERLWQTSAELTALDRSQT